MLRTRASFEQASDMREVVNLTAKERIGQRAAALVEDGDIIVLDTGTTTLHIARHIRDRQNVTVVTNDYQIARELEASPTIQIILLGGIVKKGYHCVVSINGRSILDTLNVDKAFMGGQLALRQARRLCGRYYAGGNETRHGGTCQSGDCGV
ncbi:HTH-type transcriptional repressor glcR [Raoultella planticola]|uniref:HTH-type transcriptional repressor glcR n=1 Tax=Raoultella planticola TaxID=575 RepID=A0A485CWV6_RAOPL|nr:HTH-type transcriptional repressor glcR [Raoultella planticola]